MSSWRRRQSAANRSRRQDSLLTGKRTGNFSVFGLSSQDSASNLSTRSALLPKFPTILNREFLRIEQGNNEQKQGMNGSWVCGGYASARQIVRRIRGVGSVLKRYEHHALWASARAR